MTGRVTPEMFEDLPDAITWTEIQEIFGDEYEKMIDQLVVKRDLAHPAAVFLRSETPEEVEAMVREAYTLEHNDIHAVQDMLLLVVDEFPSPAPGFEEIATWPQETRQGVVEWVSDVMANASDHDVTPGPVPDVLAAAEEGGGDGD